mmetsp:Transcript_83236/g.165254  ORF Transcript_83236/g.165254 Transcript_83236/m.165254 type:complete len:164 (-) Transcript_83236:119-610(-)
MRQFGVSLHTLCLASVLAIVTCGETEFDDATPVRTDAVSAPAPPACGGKLEICKCLLGCDIFNNKQEECNAHTDIDSVVEASVYQTMRKAGTECKAMGCVVMCAAKTDCLDSKLKARCALVNAEHPNCNADCNATQRGVSSSSGVLLVLVALVAGTQVAGNMS